MSVHKEQDCCIPRLSRQFGQAKNGGAGRNAYEMMTHLQDSFGVRAVAHGGNSMPNPVDSLGGAGRASRADTCPGHNCVFSKIFRRIFHPDMGFSGEVKHL